MKKATHIIKELHPKDAWAGDRLEGKKCWPEEMEVWGSAAGGDESVVGFTHCNVRFWNSKTKRFINTRFYAVKLEEIK